LSSHATTPDAPPLDDVLPLDVPLVAPIEAVAEAGVGASPRARAWIEKNRPRILLERVEAACKADGNGSCVEAGRELARRHPGSPESAASQKLVEAEHARILSLLQDAEALLARQMFNQRGREKAEHVCDIPGGARISSASDGTPRPSGARRPWGRRGRRSSARSAIPPS
jgi:hypothetical protein